MVSKMLPTFTLVALLAITLPFLCAGQTISPTSSTAQQKQSLVEREISITNDSGPGGRINLDGNGDPTAACGDIYRLGDVVDRGVLITASAKIGMGPAADQKEYEYWLVTNVIDPTGKKVIDYTNMKKAVNSDTNPEMGQFFLFRDECPKVGEYTIEIRLNAYDLSTSPVLNVQLDKKECKFGVYKPPVHELAPNIGAKRMKPPTGPGTASPKNDISDRDKE